MLTKAIAYHLAQLHANQQVLDTDGNIYSDHHRVEARRKVAEHTAILDELEDGNAPLEASEPLNVLSNRLHKLVGRIKRDDVRGEGMDKGFSKSLLQSAILSDMQERDALEVAIRALREIARRPVIQHRKGGTYTEYGRGILQTDVRLGDNAELVGYRDVATGRWFFRPPAEMDDGRFSPADPAAGEPIVLKTTRPPPVLVRIDGLDDRKIQFSTAEIGDIERGKTVHFTSARTDDEDIWGSYKPLAVTYIGTDVAVVTLKLI